MALQGGLSHVGPISLHTNPLNALATEPPDTTVRRHYQTSVNSAYMHRIEVIADDSAACL
jgi:hypothetical protein